MNPQQENRMTPEQEEQVKQLLKQRDEDRSRARVRRWWIAVGAIFVLWMAEDVTVRWLFYHDVLGF